MLLSPDAPAVPAATDSVLLPEPVRDHLGHALRELYGAHQTAELSSSLQALLDQLTKALDAQSDADLRAFHAGLMKALPSLRAFAISMAGRTAEADDLVQETVLRGWQNRERFTPGTNLDAWLFTIMRNHFYSLRRKRSREVEDDEGQYAAMLAVAPRQDHGVSLVEVQEALSRLPPDMRETLVLVGVQELTYEQVAAMMGVAVGTIKSRVNRARSRLAALLGYTGRELQADAMIQSAMTNRGMPRG
ncbi:RNA polymerase, sigma-24 subunit, ECF subfamily [Methylobacterium sp. 4-46]|uniref:sigma-70 family RNA polymerase sigma factor n=1 Tax=unclassified Methylobacterium TaxID=2615210 RepID=UPI000152D0A8|nr:MULTISPECIES: sigma-70 family RNA polymerase sigma factor [Methylobacterium]ACA16313.1 RNA polymerase, sigma-24 subunit, ECF subfamily [Methylobacterium sp. 4-46]WFT82021.1 sigma-70 family RNA polymerase sigma factor [Methylobacterium nodulans]